MALETNDKRNKGSKGKRKIEIKRIEGKSSRLVTFSKRRNGIFKKASELSALCGAEVAILVRSPAGRVYCYGHPSVDAIIQRYEKDERTGENRGCDERVKGVERLKAEIEQLAEENRRQTAPVGGEFWRRDSDSDRDRGMLWWANDIDGMGLQELVEFRNALEGLKNEAKKKADEKATKPNLSSHEEDNLRVSSLVEESNLLIPQSSDFRLWSY